MNPFKHIVRRFFEKNAPGITPDDAARLNQTRYNAIYALDPDVLVRHLTAFNQGDIAGLERILDEFEMREDKMKIGAFKMAAAVASKPWEVRIRKGEEDNPRARLHQETLTKFWNRIETTDAFCRNRKGGIRTLVKQMMQAQSRVYSVHDICWHVEGDGSLKATFTHVPAWCFENRSGRLRYIAHDGQWEGDPMRDGEWLVTVGEGVGVTATILAMAKRLSWNDWLLFSERCGMPVVMGNTSAVRGTDSWDAMARAIRSIAPKTGILADAGTTLNAVSMGGNGQTTYKDLIDVVDRSISALYRGGDLATMSQGGDSVGSNAQDGESELMDADGCAMISETLRDQVERFVVRFTCGDFEPLAEIVINPPAETEDVDREIKIDTHLAGLGVKLSKRDALVRYGRAEAADDDDALERPSNAPQTGFQGGFNAFANEAAGKTPFKTHNAPFKNGPRNPDPQGDADGADASRAVLAAFAKDTSNAADAVKALIADPTPEKARALLADLPNLIPEDPALAAVIAEAMAKEFRTASEDETPGLANENPYRCPKCGKFAGFNGHCDKCNYVITGNDAKKRTSTLLDAAARNAYAKPVVGISYRKGLGRIDLPVGKLGEFINGERRHGSGLSKIRAKHGIDLDHLADTLTFGEILRTRHYDKAENPENPNRKAIVYNGYLCIVAKHGGAWEISTHYKPEDDTVANIKTIAEAL